MRKFVWVILVLSILIIGATINTQYSQLWVLNPGYGGLNLSSISTNLKDGQALNLVNWLFNGDKLVARKGVSPFNTISLGGYGINGVYKYEKTSGFAKILVCYNGKVYYADPQDTAFVDHIDFAGDMVRTTTGSKVVKGTATHFTLLGYADSIQVTINDTTHYIRRIVSDTLLYLYDNWAGGTQTGAVMRQPFKVSAITPVPMLTWLNKVYIVGSTQTANWDGDSLAETIGDTTSYAITVIKQLSSGNPVCSLCVLKLTVSPTFTSKGYGYGDLVGYYITSYNDSTTDTASQPIFNKPLYIQEQGTNYIVVFADTLWSHRGHLRVNGLFKLTPKFTFSKLVYAGKADSVKSAVICTSTAGDCSKCYRRWISFYDTSQSWTRDDMNCGLYELKNITKNNISKSNVFLRKDSNNKVYVYVFAYVPNCSAVMAKGDSFEIYRYYSSTLQDIPTLIDVWQDRMFYAGYADNPNFVKFSEPFYPDSFLSATGFVYPGKNDGDIVTCIKAMAFNNCMVYYKIKHIYISSGVAGVAMTTQLVVEGIGTPVRASVVAHGREHYFYDYTGFYEFDGNQAQIISSDIEPLVDSINKDYAHLIVGGYFDKHIWWSYPSGTSTKNNRTIVYDIDNRRWGKIEGFNPASFFVGNVETDTNGVMISSADSGVVWNYGLSYLDDGQPITCTYWSPYFNMGNYYRKDFQTMKLVFDKPDSSLIIFSFYKDNTDTLRFSDTVGVDNRDFMNQKRWTLGNDRDGYNGQIRMTATKADETLKLGAMGIDWKILSELNYEE